MWDCIFNCSCRGWQPLLRASLGQVTLLGQWHCPCCHCSQTVLRILCKGKLDQRSPVSQAGVLPAEFWIACILKDIKIHIYKIYILNLLSLNLLAEATII